MRAPTGQASEVVVITLRDLDERRIAALAATGPFTVLFLASAFERFTELQRILPRNWSMPVPGDALNDAAKDLRQTVIDLDSHAWPANADRLEWDASRLGERNPLGSTTMLNLARLTMLRKAVAHPGRYLVVTDDAALARILRSEAGQSNPPSGQGRSDVGVGRRVALAWRFLMRKLALATFRRRRPLPLDGLRSADVLLTVWGRPDTFPDNGRLEHEHNFGRLPQLLRQAGYRVAYLVYPLTWVSSFDDILKNVGASREPVALIEDFIPWWAGVTAALFGLRFPAKMRGPSVDPATGAVLRLEAARDRRLAFMAEAMLLRHVGAGLARFGIRPRLLMHLYEGQPWEKMLARGIRESLPATRVAAVQHAPFASNFASFFPSQGSIAEQAIPDLLLTPGEGYAQWLRDAGVADAQTGVIGALRYDHAPALAPPGRAILCCTGIDLDEAAELATKAALATDSLDRPLTINFHPVTDEGFRTRVRGAVAQALPAAARHFTFSTASMRELLGDAGVVLYTTSAACFEAVQAGRRAIYVGRDLDIDYDKLPDAIAVRCRSVNELRDLLRASGEGTQQTSAALTGWLSPVVDSAALRGLIERTEKKDMNR